MQQLDGPNRNSKCVILYVEDSDAMAYLLQKALEHNGTDIQLFRIDSRCWRKSDAPIS